MKMKDLKHIELQMETNRAASEVDRLWRLNIGLKKLLTTYGLPLTLMADVMNVLDNDLKKLAQANTSTLRQKKTTSDSSHDDPNCCDDKDSGGCCG